MKKWLFTLQAHAVRLTAFRLNFLLLVLGPALVFFGVKISLWLSIFHHQPDAVLGGYTQQEMLEFQTWTLIIALLSQSYNASSLAEDIRLGRITTWLLYPFSFLNAQFAAYLSFFLIQILASSILLCLAHLAGFVSVTDPLSLLGGSLLCCISALLWYFLQLAAGFLAFWLEEVWVLRVLIQMSIQFLSGAILPLSFFPEGFKSWLSLSPFPLMTQIPADVFMGRTPPFEMLHYGLGIAWILVFLGLSRLIFQRGLRLYTAAGI